MMEINTSWKLTGGGGSGDGGSGGGGGGALLVHACEVRSLLFHAFLCLTNGCAGPCAFTLGWKRHGNKIQGV